MRHLPNLHKPWCRRGASAAGDESSRLILPARRRVTVKTSIYAMAIETYVPMLRSLSHVLDKGAAHARAKKSNAADLVNARLAPDMYTLAQQVRMACDQAIDSTARLSGQDAPPFANNEKTLEELKVRIAKTLEYVERVRENAFEG